MTKLSNKLSLGLLLGSFSLSTLTSHANPLPLETLSSHHNATGTTAVSAKPEDTAKLLTDLRQGHQQIEAALVRGAAAEALAENLRKQNVALKWQHATSKAKVEELRQQAEEQAKEESKSIWASIKNWFKDVDGTKVATTIISGIVTIVVAIIAIL